MRLRAIIIDDELHSIETLRFDLDRCAKDKLEVVASFQSMKEALKGLKSLNIDLIFTDIDMPHINGLEGISMMQADKVKVVFITAHRKFALDAIKVGAYDYLLKPVQLEELSKLVDKIYFETQQKPQIKGPERIALPTSEGIELVLIEDILFIKAESNYTAFFLKNGKQLVLSKPLKHFQEKMPVSFLRIHQSYVVNINHIKKYLRKDGGNLQVGNHMLPISKSHKEEVKKVLERLM